MLTSVTGQVEELINDIIFRQSLLTLNIDSVLPSNFSSIALSIINKFKMLESTLPCR